MPVAQAVTERKNRTAAKASISVEANSSTTLRSPSSAEKSAWGKALRSRSAMCNDLMFLDDPIEYPFKNSDRVWVRTQQSNWCPGKVCREDFRVGQTRIKQGFFYRVRFGTRMNVQKYFAPMNGEIKPDNEDVRRLLIQEGWIEDDDSYTSDSSGDLYHDA